MEGIRIVPSSSSSSVRSTISGDVFVVDTGSGTGATVVLLLVIFVVIVGGVFPLVAKREAVFVVDDGDDDDDDDDDEVVDVKFELECVRVAVNDPFVFELFVDVTMDFCCEDDFIEFIVVRSV